VKESVRQVDRWRVVRLREGWIIETKGVAYGTYTLDKERTWWCIEEPSWSDVVGEVFIFGKEEEV